MLSFRVLSAFQKFSSPTSSLRDKPKGPRGGSHLPFLEVSDLSGPDAVVGADGVPQDGPVLIGGGHQVEALQ